MNIDTVKWAKDNVQFHGEKCQRSQDNLEEAQEHLNKMKEKQLRNALRQSPLMQIIVELKDRLHAAGCRLDLSITRPNPQHDKELHFPQNEKERGEMHSRISKSSHLIVVDNNVTKMAVPPPPGTVPEIIEGIFRGIIALKTFKKNRIEIYSTSNGDYAHRVGRLKGVTHVRHPRAVTIVTIQHKEASYSGITICGHLDPYNGDVGEALALIRATKKLCATNTGLLGVDINKILDKLQKQADNTMGKPLRDHCKRINRRNRARITAKKTPKINNQDQWNPAQIIKKDFVTNA